jgi:hypothetical protein
VGSRFLAASVSGAAPVSSGGDPQGRRQSHQRAIVGQKNSKEGSIEPVETIQDFEDLLHLLHRHHVRYLIIGGLAFIYHAKPRYTKDMDIWIDPSEDNVKLANIALAEFGSPYLLNAEAAEEILQLGVAPDRIDLLRAVKGARFDTAWKNRIRGKYGKANANWIDLNSLLRIKSRIEHPRHQEDVRVLREVRRRRKGDKSR